MFCVFFLISSVASTKEQIEQVLFAKWNTKTMFTLANLPKYLEPVASSLEAIDSTKLYAYEKK